MRWGFLLLWMVLCGQGAPAFAQDEANSAQACTWDTARAASIAEVARNAREWIGACVRVRGLHVARWGGPDDRILVERMAVRESAGPRPGALIIDARDGVGHERHRPGWEEVLGTVGSCQAAYEAARARQVVSAGGPPPPPVMLGGLCHYTSDPYLRPLAYRASDGPPVARIRRTELSAGDLEFRVLAPDGAEARYREIAERMFAAVEAADFDAYLALDDPPLAEKRRQLGETGLNEGERVNLGLDRDHFADVVAAWRSSRMPAQAMTYGLAEVRANGPVGHVLVGRDRQRAVLWCRLRDGASADDLPALQRDNDNDPSRPYFCVEAQPWVLFKAGTVPSAAVPLYRLGFVETAQ
jgi:hypothetical protein